jgi:hypothetical protein
VISRNCANLGCTAGRTNYFKKLYVCFVIIGPLLRNIVLIVDSFNRANGLTGSTVNTLIRVDIEHAVAFIDAIHWAFFNAGLVLKVNAGQSDYVSHVSGTFLLLFY